MIHGHLYDSKHVLADLKSLDPRLYVKWNPAKLKGWGCWEVRIRPIMKTIVDYAEYDGTYYFKLDYRENNFENHIIDCAFLNQDLIRKLKTMDTHDPKHWWHHTEYLQDKMIDDQTAKAAAELKYLVKYNKKMFQDFMELVRSGINPAQIISDGQWVYKNQ